VLGPRQTALQAGEIVTAIHVPAPDDRGVSDFLKLGARHYLVISIAMVASVIHVDDEARVSRAGVAVGACSPVARRLPALEARLIGRRAGDGIGRRAGGQRPRCAEPDQRRARHGRVSPGRRLDAGAAHAGALRGRAAMTLARTVLETEGRGRHGAGRLHAERPGGERGGRPDAALSAVLRDTLGLTGTKVGCDAGDCGACTVLVDGEAICACMVPAGRLDGVTVETVEGLGRDGRRRGCRPRSCGTGRRSAASARRAC
jgi:hypothetical protein